ncbi:DNA-binding transcriptional regulator, LysR family [Pseudomonas cuatrocienegasensis]|uniref:DNA-binding transcriptional regulator, LysR family n=1 Tax=Pseudomonas cuatrocienegasensis TaxID=543360 RepID=A0ABY1AZP8_9PSED|nr:MULTISPECIES: LysR family transcriptional regulator [Pseudomonas]OEC36231.1 LysR family transcriptional regulator [Pseudomonas sp. 21C1]SEP59179.1 DNA-binding transcriptional regulator, LysR family [Pseudomonas cuatrocienegasensis]
MSRYRQMQVFDAVVQAGSLAAAARQLNHSPATIMRSVALLESRLNNTLLIRGPRGVELSPSGELFAVSCRQILEQTAVAERSAAGLHASPAGQLSVSLPMLMDQQVFTAIALDYLAAFPEVQLVTRASEGVPKLLEENIDVALVVGHLPNSSGFAMPVGRVRPIVCASPTYLAKWGRPQIPDDLKVHRSVLTTADGPQNEWRFRYERTTRLVKPTPVLTCTTQRAAIHAATLGLGLIRCMSYEAHHELQNGLLEPVLSDFASEDLPVQLIYRDGRRAEARVRTFIDFATPRLRAHPAFIG